MNLDDNNNNGEADGGIYHGITQPGCESVNHRDFLIFSHIAFLLPLVYLCIRVRPVAWIEIVLLICTTLFSTLHHLCANPEICGYVCVTQSKILYGLDFQFAFQQIAIVLVYQVESKFWLFKLSIHAIVGGITALFFWVFKWESTQDYAGFVAGVGLVVILIRVAYRIRQRSMKHCFKAHLKCTDLILAALCGSTAVTFKALGDNDIMAYWIAHSLWQILAALTIFFSLHMSDGTSVLDCRVMSSSYHRAEDDLGYEDDAL